MQFTNFTLENRVELAKTKLSQHRNRGTQSHLSIFQVAQLMDTIKNRNTSKYQENSSIFFSLN